MLEGPFDFESGFKVPETAWKALVNGAEEARIYVGAVNRVVPLDKPDALDKDVKDGVSSYLMTRWNFFNGAG
jgi:hypothetical protein